LRYSQPADRSACHWRDLRSIGDNSPAMKKPSRRDFLMTASAATLAVVVSPSLPAAKASAAPPRQRVFVGSNTPDGVLAYDWDSATGDLAPKGVAAKLANVDWMTFSPGHEYLYAASEVDSFNGRPTGAVAGFRFENGSPHLICTQNSAGKGTCHVALDRTGRVLLSADYGGGSAASFIAMAGSLSPVIWSERYKAHGPNADRQQSAHAHFASFSPDNRFAYINDLGGDCIHIYSLDTETALLKPAGQYSAQPGAGPRTLHFHPNGHTAYSVNELNSTVDVLEWSKADGGLTLATRIELLPAGYQGITRACDTVISKDGRFVYFANRDNDFLYSFRADATTGALTPIARSSCGGKIPRNFTLDPTERWMLVANQDSNLIAVFARNPETGVLAEQGKSFAAAAPMCILFA
jgi:6-phosphogluconolactonase